jgi:serine protease AprX
MFEIQPNPVRDKVIVRYALSKKTRVKLSIFDIAGRIVTTLSDKDQNPGAHRENYEITNLPQGVYFITIDIDGKQETRKIILLR